MIYENNVIIGSSSITCLSSNNDINMEALISGLPFYSLNPFSVDCFEFQRNGRIAEELIANILDSFDIKPKNKKFFDRSSAAIFYCVNSFARLIERSAAPDTALFVSTGPANTRLSDFIEWGRESASDKGSIYPKLMASSVVKLLPNIVMSNISINMGINGENAIFSATSAAPACALESACMAIEDKTTPSAIAAAVSMPYEYFNIDSYRRFFYDDFFTVPLCEGASALMAFDRETVLKDAGLKNAITGSIKKIDVFKMDDKLCRQASTDGRGFIDALKSEYGVDVKKYEIFKLNPSGSGNFLSASEPLSVLSVMSALNSKMSTGEGLSICADYFGNVSVITAAGKYGSS